ncbi:MAG TPA: hypothetical protein VGE01_14710 [Fimbriimonas sp.]
MKRYLTWLTVLCLGLLSVWFGSSLQAAGFPPVAELNFRNEELLDSHWKKHRNEFRPVVTKEQYLAYARAFFTNNSKGKELKYRGRDVLHYRESTNEFGVLSGEPVIRTYFRPSSGRRYWDRQ